MNFTEDSIGGAQQRGARSLRKAYDALAPRSQLRASRRLVSSRVRERFFAALDDDMNTAGALGALFDVAALVPKIVNARRGRAKQALGVLGVGELPHAQSRVGATRSIDPAIVERSRRGRDAVRSTARVRGAIERVIDARNAARKARDFALADRLRNALAAEGIVLTDGKDGSTTWTVAGA